MSGGGPHERLEHSLAEVISLLLIAGVGLSAVLLVLGLLLLFVTGSTGYQGSFTSALILAPSGTVAFPRSIGAVIAGSLALKPFALIELGLLVLIATPVFRVAASSLLFLLERDYLYTAITLAVLAVLLYSILWVR